MAKLAVSAMCWHRDYDFSQMECWRRMGIMGLEVVPGKMLPSWPLVEDSEIAEISRAINVYGLSIPAMQGIFYNQPQALLFDNPAGFVQAIELLALLAHKLNCPYLIYGAPNSRKRRNMSDEEALSRAMGVLRPVCNKIHELGIKLLIEHVPSYYNCDFINTPEQALELIKIVDSPGFGLHLDIGALDYIEELDYYKFSQHIHASEQYLKPFKNSLKHIAASSIIPSNRWISLEMQPNPDGELKTVENIEYFVNTYNK